jgi:hypothetical protein
MRLLTDLDLFHNSLIIPLQLAAKTWSKQHELTGETRVFTRFNRNRAHDIWKWHDKSPSTPKGYGALGPEVVIPAALLALGSAPRRISQLG